MNPKGVGQFYLAIALIAIIWGGFHLWVGSLI